jgi:hypothetical protein
MTRRHVQHPPARSAKALFARAGAGVLRAPRGVALVVVLALLTIGAVSIPALAAHPAKQIGAAVVPPSSANSALRAADIPDGALTIRPSATAWTSTRYPAKALSQTPYLSATKTADKTYLSFDLSALQGSTVASVMLQLHVASTIATQPGVQVFASSSGWDAGTLTNSNRPADDPTLVSTTSVQAVGGQIISVPIDPKALPASGTVSFRLGYAQPFVGNTFTRTGDFAPKLIVSLGQGSAVSPTPPPSVGSPEASSSLAFSVAGSNTSSKKVFAHYFPPYPISIDNKPAASDYYTRNYLAPNGEGGIHQSTGGLLRDRPEPRPPLADNWQVTDMATEVTEASDEGIDGFTVDVLSLSGANWTNTVNLMTGAVQSGRNFSIVPNLDMTASAGNAGIPAISAALAQLYQSPAAYRLASGEYVLSSFAAERQSPAWWAQLKATMASSYGDKIALISVFLNASDSNITSYAPVSYAEGNWGTRTPVTVNAAPNYAAKAHAAGTKWMAPVAVQDERPHNSLYAEAGNTETLRATWGRALSDGADLVQMVTWNDYSESTSFAPSVNHGMTFLDISAYYETEFKTGEPPSITGDAMYVTQRVQFAGSIPSLNTTPMQPTLSGTSMKPRDTVEVLTFLTKSAAVTVTVGGVSTTYTAQAGLDTHLVPLRVGVVSATAQRGASTILKVVSPYLVVAKPAVQDLEYYGVSSRGE